MPYDTEDYIDFNEIQNEIIEEQKGEDEIMNHHNNEVEDDEE